MDSLERNVFFDRIFGKISRYVNCSVPSIDSSYLIKAVLVVNPHHFMDARTALRQIRNWNSGVSRRSPLIVIA